MTALARKLVVVVWHLLTNEEPYRYTEPHVARRKLRKTVPPELRKRVKHVPETIEAVYKEAGLPPIMEPTLAERRAAATNRRARTRISNSMKSY